MKKKYPINNKVLLPAVLRWKESGNEGMSDELGELLYKLAKNLLNHRHFKYYSDAEKEDMLSEGLLTAIKYGKNFNPEKSNNPFAYFTQIIKNGFYGVRNKEYDQQAGMVDYWLNNAEEVDVTDDYTMLLIDNLEANRRSKSKKKSNSTESQTEQKRTLF